MAKAYRSEAAMVVYEMMADLHKEGIIDDAALHEFDDCIVQSPEGAPKPADMRQAPRLAAGPGGDLPSRRGGRR
jgi:hypothetical protein